MTAVSNRPFDYRLLDLFRRIEPSAIPAFDEGKRRIRQGPEVRLRHHGQPPVRENLTNLTGAVPAIVPQELVIHIVQLRARRHLNDNDSARLEDSRDLPHGFLVVLDVFKNIENHDCVQARSR